MAAVSIVAIGGGCQSSQKVRTTDLMVVEQTDTLFGGNEGNRHERAVFTVDVPVNGPEALEDSVLAFINQELYDACESCAHVDEDVVTFSKEEMFSDDAERLLSHYTEKYRPAIQDSLWKDFGLTIAMEAQTDKFVTYGLEFYHCGAGCSSQKFYYTFDKDDGHRIREIVSQDNLVRFFEDYPEYSTIEGNAWTGEPEWKFFPENGYDNPCFGLLDDHFSLVIEGQGSQYMLTRFPYSQIFSYLSPEAQSLVKQDSEEETMLPAYVPERSEDGQAWMETDTINNALLGYISAAGGPRMSKLMNFEYDLEAYPISVHSIQTSEGSTLFLFICSQGHLLYYDMAIVCEINNDNYLQPVSLFQIENRMDSIVDCMWYDQLVAASDGFPYDEFDRYRFGIHYDRFTKRLYVPIMDSHDEGSEFANTNCLLYTGRFGVLQFKEKAFVYTGTDGAWWLNPDLRNYKRTVSNRITADGIEQIDLMPDNTYRHAVWKGAKTLDDLRKKPDEVTIEN